MDVHIRYFDNLEGRCKSLYLTSEFLDSSKGEDLLEGLLHALNGINLLCLVSVSMDGPHVNHKALRLLQAHLKVTPESPILIEFGSCSLHVVHGSLKTGETAAGWNSSEYLKKSYYLFNNFPSRKALFTELTKCEEFPVKFCSTRWMENKSAANLGIKLLPKMREFCSKKEFPKSKVYAKVSNCYHSSPD